MSNGNGQDQGPWGKRPQQGPPDLLELLKKFFAGAKKNSTSGGGSAAFPISKIIGLGIAVVVFVWAVSGIFIVKPAEEGVILRFGKYVSTVGAGPHWVPPLIERRFVLDTQQVRNFPYRAEMLTKDENIVSVAVAVQYRIADPKAFLFNVVEPVKALQQATSSALRQAVGQMSLDSVLTTGRQLLRDRVATQLNTVLSRYKTGLTVTDLTLQPAKPPEEVTAAFDDAIKAREDEQRYINQAEAYVQKVTSVVKGKMARLTQSAEAYKQEVVLRAKGQTARFLALLNAYKRAPVVTRERLYLEGVQSVLSQTHNVVVDTGHSNMLYLPIDQILKHQIAAKSANDDEEATPPLLSETKPTMTEPNTRPSYSGGYQ